MLQFFKPSIQDTFFLMESASFQAEFFSKKRFSTIIQLRPPRRQLDNKSRKLKLMCFPQQLAETFSATRISITSYDEFAV